MLKNKEIRPLTGLRGLAALFVVLFHFSSSFSISSASTRFLHQGYLSVDLFFILSGLVLAMNHDKDFRTNAFDIKTYFVFLKKRCARIYPVYIIVLLIAIGIALEQHFLRHKVLPEGWSAKKIISNVLLIQAWGFDKHALVPPSWSLSTEVAAYVFFPILFSVAVVSRKSVMIVTLVCCFALLRLSATGEHGDTDPNPGYLDIVFGDSPQALMRCVAGFTFGLLAYRLTLSPVARKAIVSDVMFALSLVGVALSLAIGAHAFVVYALIWLLVLSSSGNSTAANLCLGNPIVRYVGVISFSLYLTHIFLLVYLTKLQLLYVKIVGSATGGGFPVFVILIALAIASVVYYAIEKPGSRYLARRLNPRREITVGVAPINL